MSVIGDYTQGGIASSGVLTGQFRRTARLVDDEVSNRAVDAAVARAKQGDREALRFLYVRYADHVYGYVASIVRDDYEAEDVTQHLFAKLMTALPKYEPREVPFSAWILRVARNVAVDHMRQRRAIPCEEVRELSGHERGRRRRARDRALGLRDALATLPEDQRQVVVMRHLVGLSPGEIAGRLGRTEPSIHGLHHRGRGALRSALAEMDCAPTIARRRWRRDARSSATADADPGHPPRPGRPGAARGAARGRRRASRAQRRVHAWAPSSRPSRTSSPPTAARRTRSASPPAPRRSRSRCARWTSARATRSSSRRTRSSRRPRPSAGSARRRSSSTSTRRTHLLTAEPVAAAIGPRTRAVIPVHLMGSTVDLDPILALARASTTCA